jgi:carbamoyltransferase
MEYGPRALGARSILADPRVATMRDVINSKVKKREAFRAAFDGFDPEKVARYGDADRGAVVLALDPGLGKPFAG